MPQGPAESEDRARLLEVATDRLNLVLSVRGNAGEELEKRVVVVADARDPYGDALARSDWFDQQRAEFDTEDRRVPIVTRVLELAEAARQFPAFASALSQPATYGHAWVIVAASGGATLTTARLPADVISRRAVDAWFAHKRHCEAAGLSPLDVRPEFPPRR